MSALLPILRNEVAQRSEQIAETHGDWPCRKGCDDCCRSLAAVPTVSETEWAEISAALDSLPAETARLARRRIADSEWAVRPVVCPLLDLASGSCLVYSARPIACRSYGFYAERELVLGCWRIEEIAAGQSEVVWGNHVALEARVGELGAAQQLWVWEKCS